MLTQNHFFPRLRKVCFVIFLLSFTFCIGLGLGFLNRHFSYDGRFSQFTKELFCRELTSSTLNLHYTLANPEQYHLCETPVTLGCISYDGILQSIELAKEYEQILMKFPREQLTKENQLILDTLLLYFHTETEHQDTVLLQEPLGASLGIQAQLPVLLAEYPFYSKEDITDYLRLLTCIRPYFENILLFEQKKSENGLFMSDTSLMRIIDQCQSFIQDSSSNYLTDIFSEKLQNFPSLTKNEISLCMNEHRKILEQSVIPAYQRLIQGLLALKGTGKNVYGLAYLKNGKKYYEYLLKNQIGTWDSVDVIQKRMYQQLFADCKEITTILQRHPEYENQLLTDSFPDTISPENMLSVLYDQCFHDFPSLKSVNYEIKYVHPSMEAFLSPAFYLTPPIDTGFPNTIYINRGTSVTDLELFSTLAHEGFPGHLYQTQYFNSQNPNPIRQLYTSPGYIEGWATYIESFAYGYSSVDSDFARLVWLNRSVNLCLCSLTDLGIHYQGWTPESTAKFLSIFGITNQKAIQNLYQYIVETPANYLKYYYGYLNFLDLQNTQKQLHGDSFDLKSFHQKILEIGPVPFPLLKKYYS